MLVGVSYNKSCAEFYVPVYSTYQALFVNPPTSSYLSNENDIDYIYLHLWYPINEMHHFVVIVVI